MRFSFTVILAAPFLALGVVGISGYPLTYFLKVAYQWFQTKGILLYDHSIRLLEVSLLENRMNQTDLRDKVFDIYEKHISPTLNKEKGKAMIEGVDFKFAQDKEEQAVMANRESETTLLPVEGEEEEEFSLVLPGSEPAQEGLQDVPDALIFEGEESDISFVEIVPDSPDEGEDGNTEPIEEESARDTTEPVKQEADVDQYGHEEHVTEEPSAQNSKKDSGTAQDTKKSSKKKKKKKKGAGSRHG